MSAADRPARRSTTAAGKIPGRIRWAVEMLAPEPDDRVLEIGCGGGHAVALLCERVTAGIVIAIDRSAVMVRRALDRNRFHIATGRARIEHVALEDARFGDQAFDRLLAINVNVFWTQAATALDRVSRMLVPSGLLCLVYQPPVATTTGELARELSRVLPEHGFDVPSVAFRDVEGGAAVCLTSRTRR